jgi:GAF domain-containing protein
MADAGEPGDVAASIVEMQALLLGTETIQEFLTELAGLAILAVGDGLSCGITLQPNGRPLTVASTDTLAAQVDEVQYGLDQGPCLHALRTGTLVSIQDLASDQRWAAYAATALQHGVRSSLSLPLSSGSGTLGAFNLYSLVILILRWVRLTAVVRHGADDLGFKERAEFFGSMPPSHS